MKQLSLTQQGKRNYKQQKLQAFKFDKNYLYQSQTGIAPCVFFWKFLPKINNLAVRCLIPDTIILNDGQLQTLWLYTNQYGIIEKSNILSLKDFIKKLTFQTTSQQLVAIMKKPSFKGQSVTGNDIKLLNSRALSSLQFSSTQGVTIIQRFVKSSGNKAYICRTVWRSHGKSQSLIITNNNQYQNSSVNELKRYIARVSQQSLIVKTGTGRHFYETVGSLKSIVKFMNWAHGIEMNQIVGDFVKDQMGNWWLINIKAFKIARQIKRIHGHIMPEVEIIQASQNCQKTEKHEKQKYQKTKTCKYCQKAYIESQLKYKMTIKMIIETDRHLLHRGKTFKWLRRSDIGNIQTHSLYEQHRVCQRCYKLYMYTQQLMQIQCKFAEKLGIPITSETKYNLVLSVGSNYLEQESKNRQIDKLVKQLPQQIQLGPNSKLLIKNNYPIKNDQMISKMIRYRFIIYLVSIDQVNQYDRTKNYFIEYSFINCKIKYKIQLGDRKNIIPLNKLRVIYLFSHNRKSFNQFLSNNQFLTINIITQTIDKKKQRMLCGKLDLQLKDFLSDKVIKRQYYKMFNLKDVSWGWGLSANIGLVDSNGEVDTSRTIFKNYKGLVYYPQSSDYYSCEPLPQEWMTLIKQKNIQNQSEQQSMNSTKTQNHIQIYKKKDKVFEIENNTTLAKRILTDEINKYEKGIKPRLLL